MDFLKLEDFYQVYDQHRTYVRAEARPKPLSPAAGGLNFGTPWPSRPWVPDPIH